LSFFLFLPLYMPMERGLGGEASSRSTDKFLRINIFMVFGFDNNVNLEDVG
jgi:hypothetical protein